DGPRAVALSLFGVVLLVGITVRRLRPVLIVLGTLVGGLGIMLGIAAVSGIRINFLNFVSIPITIGVGADYAINLVRRHQSEPQLAPQKLIATTGGAVVLCSMTTIIGYGTLLVATNRAIASFGLLAALGEIACLTTAMLLLPSLLMRVSTAREM